MRFREGALQIELEKRGIGHREFAKLADISGATIVKGNKGLSLSKETYRKIVNTLNATPPLEAPEGLQVAL